MANSILNKAKRKKEDEFYTQMKDVEKEVSKYEKTFFNKVIFCNCDDPYESNFFKFFTLNFNKLHLKKLICTCYVPSPVSEQQILFPTMQTTCNEKKKYAYKIEINSVPISYSGTEIEKLICDDSNYLGKLKGDGDFRSPECVELLQESDIVCTNPPFSLFREFVSLLVNNKKQFLIIGNQNAIKYKEIFPLIKENKIWLGYHCGDMEFVVPSYYEPHKTRYREQNGVKYRSLGNVCWYTNLDTEKRHQPIVLTKKYDVNLNPKYDSYDAIEVSRYADIPCDYSGVMGVPITFMLYHCPEQFEVIGELNHGKDNEWDFAVPRINGTEKYTRILIKHR